MWLEFVGKAEGPVGGEGQVKVRSWPRPENMKASKQGRHGRFYAVDR